MTFSDRFSDVGDTYPGSKQPRREPQKKVEARKKEEASDRWDAKPLRYKVDGAYVEFFTVGQLAKALNRKPVTIRAWEINGVIPPAIFRTPSAAGVGPQSHGRRLYTRAQVEGMIKAAQEEGILDIDDMRQKTNDERKRSFASSGFSGRVWTLFKELAQ